MTIEQMANLNGRDVRVLERLYKQKIAFHIASSKKKVHPSALLEALDKFALVDLGVAVMRKPKTDSTE